jgi:hypothetical protein
MGIIIDRDSNDLYRIAVRAGVLKGKYSRNQFDLCTQKLLLESESFCKTTMLRLEVLFSLSPSAEGKVLSNAIARGLADVRLIGVNVLN